MTDLLELALNFLPKILSFFRGNSFLWPYFCYTIGFILTTFALMLVTSCLKDNKPSTIIFAFTIKLTIFVFLKILEDTLTH